MDHEKLARMQNAVRIGECSRVAVSATGIAFA